MAAPDAGAPGWAVVGRVVDWVIAWTPARGRSLPIDRPRVARALRHRSGAGRARKSASAVVVGGHPTATRPQPVRNPIVLGRARYVSGDRKSTRLNSSHLVISYA